MDHWRESIDQRWALHGLVAAAIIAIDFLIAVTIHADHLYNLFITQRCIQSRYGPTEPQLDPPTVLPDRVTAPPPPYQ